MKKTNASHFEESEQSNRLQFIVAFCRAGAGIVAVLVVWATLRSAWRVTADGGNLPVLASGFIVSSGFLWASHEMERRRMRGWYVAMALFLSPAVGICLGRSMPSTVLIASTLGLIGLLSIRREFHHSRFGRSTGSLL